MKNQGSSLDGRDLRNLLVLPARCCIVLHLLLAGCSDMSSLHMLQCHMT